MIPGFTADIALKIVMAFLLGGLIGWQRELAHKPAGLRTHVLIVLGATVVMETSHFAGDLLGGDPTRIASNVIVGIGFIGAGTIMKEGPTVYGLTTAATIWVEGALGLAIGAGFYGMAAMLTLAIMIVLVAFAPLESIIVKKRIVRRYQVLASDDAVVVGAVERALGSAYHRRGLLDFRREGGHVALSFEFEDVPAKHKALFDELRSMQPTIEVRSS